MHCCLNVCAAAAKVREERSESRALSVPVLNDGSIAKSAETTANDLLHFMAQPPKVEKHDEWRRTRSLRTPHEGRPGLCAGCHLRLSMQFRADHSDDEYRSRS